MARAPAVLDLFDLPPEVDFVEEAPPKTAAPLSVTQLAAQVKSKLEGTFGRVVVQGEVSGAKLHGSGHFYFDLKDEGAVLTCVAWRSTVARWSSIPVNGTQLVVRGKLTTYAQRSNYQLMVDSVETAGLGALMQQLEALKQKLFAEGLFNPENKKDIPFLPTRIGLITSPTGAVIQDMLHRLADRCPRNVTLWPVAVQGAGAAEQVAAAIIGFNNMPEAKRPDLLIIARGGGSFEDLMPFNAEILVRAVAGSAIPTISGVGHEPDVTLCDFAADVRAPTPSAAAEMAVPVREDLLYTLSQQRRRLHQAAMGTLTQHRSKLAYLARLLPDPRRQLLQSTQRLSETEDRLRRALPNRLSLLSSKLESLNRILTANSPQAPLERGYVYLTRGTEPLRSATAEPGPITLHFIDGQREGTLQ